MIPRYSRPEMTAIWAPENRFRIWFEIEAHACDAQAALGIIPKSAAREVWRKGKWEIARIDQIERETKHDVIAFLTHLAEIVGPEARFVHQGMTSSDVLDACFAVQLARSSDLLIEGVVVGVGIDHDQTGQALKRLSAAEDLIPADDPAANAAESTVWETIGLALMVLALASQSLRSWEAAVEFFRASPEVVRLVPFDIVERWGGIAERLTEASPLVAAVTTSPGCTPWLAARSRQWRRVVKARSIASVLRSPVSGSRSPSLVVDFSVSSTEKLRRAGSTAATSR